MLDLWWIMQFMIAIREIYVIFDLPHELLYGLVFGKCAAIRSFDDHAVIN